MRFFDLLDLLLNMFLIAFDQNQ